MIKKLALLTFACMSIFQIQAQDPHFSQFYANPLYLNPALTGSNIGARFLLNYRNQWSALPGYVTYSASYDQYVPKMAGGIGMQVLADFAGDNVWTHYQASLSYAHFLKINNDWSLRSGFKASYVQKSLDYSNLRFNDQFDSKLGYLGTPSQEPFITSLRNANYADFSAGMMVFSEKIYGGFAVDHLTTPNESLLPGGFVQLPARLTLNAGSNIKISNGNSRKEATIFSPNIIYMKQKTFSQLNIGAYVNRGPFTGGVWYRQAGKNADAFILLAGVQQDAFRLGYSYDITVSKLRAAATGAHEITLGLLFEQIKRSKGKKVERIKCPAF